LGSVVTDWVSLEGTARTPIRPGDITTELVDTFLPLSPDLDALATSRRMELETKAKVNAKVWNGHRFALIGFNRTRQRPDDEEAPAVHLQFAKTDYATFQAIRNQLDVAGLVRSDLGIPTTIRQKYFSRFDPDHPPRFLCHSLGINFAVVTADGKIAFVRRAAQTQLGHAYSIPMNEGMQYPADLDIAGRPSPLLTTVRGLWEELGIDCNELNIDANEAVVYFNFGVVASISEYALLGRVRLAIGSEELVDRHRFLA
jgi:hypothetical protein